MMDGVHDLGGKPGFGRVDKSGGEKVFQATWEAKVFAMVNAGAMAGAWHNVDRFRHAIERVHPEAYLAHGYYVAQSLNQPCLQHLEGHGPQIYDPLTPFCCAVFP